MILIMDTKIWVCFDKLLIDKEPFDKEYLTRNETLVSSDEEQKNTVNKQNLFEDSNNSVED